MSLTKKTTYFISFLVFFFGILVFTVNAETGTTANVISLQNAIDLGIRQDNQYKNQILELEINRLNQEKAQMKKLFSIDFSGSYLFKSERMVAELPFSIPIAGGGSQPVKINAGTLHNFDLKTSLTQPIYTGNILSNSLKLEIQKEVLEKYKKTLIEIELRGRIKASYFTLKLLENKKKSIQLLLDNLKLHLDKITELYNEELIRKSDLLETEIKINETKINIADIERSIAEEKVAFKRLTTVEFDNVETNYDEIVGTPLESMMIYKTNHPVLKTLDQNLQILTLKRKITTGSYLPQVGGFAELHYGKPGLNFFKDKWSIYFQGGISVNLKIFDWNQLKKEKSIIDASASQLENKKEDLLLEMQKSIDQLYIKKGTIEKQFLDLDRMIELALEDVSLKSELYKEHQVSNVDYLSSLIAYERYISLKNERSVEYQLVKLNINTLIGRNGEEK